MDHAIEVRRLAFDLDAALSRHGCGGQPFATHLRDALSSAFPDGEAFFVRSVLRYRERARDPALRAAPARRAGTADRTDGPPHGAILGVARAR
jgi:hypothetical protein